MTAHHFFTDPASMAEGVVTLRGEEARHASRVLRLHVGEPITVSDNTGRVVDAVVTRTDGVVEAAIRSETWYERPRPEIVLCQALVKGEKLDDVVEKATEVGVARIVPYAAERSIVRWDDRKRARAVDRWRAIATAAAKQSHAAVVPEVCQVGGGVSAAARRADLVIVLHEADGLPLLRDVLPRDAPDTLAIVVGPEGGLTTDEVSSLTALDARAARLGPRILRTETAGLVATSIIAYAYGSLG